jgi:tetratricopeptide (TPR) repeat protein
MARRLGIPLRDLVQAPPAPGPDLTTIAGEIDLALTEIAVLLHQQQAAAALQQLTDLAATHQDQLSRLLWSARYRLHLLRAEAHLRMGHRQDARGAAEAALALTEDQADPDASLAARTVLGTILLQAGAVQAAQELLEQCWQTLDRAQVPDPQLALRIYERLLTT